MEVAILLLIGRKTGDPALNPDFSDLDCHRAYSSEDFLERSNEVEDYTYEVKW